MKDMDTTLEPCDRIDQPTMTPKHRTSGDRKGVLLLSPQSRRKAMKELAIPRRELKAAITATRRAIAEHQRALEQLEKLLDSPPLPSATKGAAKRARTPEGQKTLRETIVEVLRRSKRPLKPKDLRDRILASGYQTSAQPRSFYITVFMTANKHPSVINTDDGFRLRKNARVLTEGDEAPPPKRARGATKKAKKKRARKRS